MLSFHCLKKYAEHFKDGVDPETVKRRELSPEAVRMIVALAHDVLSILQDRDEIIEVTHDLMDEIKNDCVGVPRRERLLERLRGRVGEPK